MHGQMSDAFVQKHKHLRIDGALEMHSSSQNLEGKKNTAVWEHALSWAKLQKEPFSLNSFTELYVHTLSCYFLI